MGNEKKSDRVQIRRRTKRFALLSLEAARGDKTIIGGHMDLIDRPIDQRKLVVQIVRERLQ